MKRLRQATSAPTWTVLLICCLAQFMVVLDVSVVNVALPQMRHDLGLSVTGQQWVVNAYTLTFAGFLMLGGRAADLFGRRRIFMVGLGLFTLCSLLGGLAQDGPWLIGARAAQGLGGAVLAPATLSLLTTTFTEMHERRRALGAWSATAASGAAVGVLAGGILTNYLDWRWVLFVNVPIGILLFIGSALYLTESKATNVRQSLDLPGAITVTAGLAILVYGIVGTDTHPWASAATVIPLALGAAILAAFFIIEARFAQSPLVPLGVFRLRSLSVANGIAVMVGSSLFGFYFFMSLYVQQVNGYSPLKAGLAFLPSGLATLLAAFTGSRLVAKIGPKRQLLLGPVLGAAGMLWLTNLSAGSPYWSAMFVPLVLIGVGLGFSFVPMTLAGTAGVPHHQAGLASGLLNTTRQVGGAVGLAAMATIATSVTRHHAVHGALTPSSFTAGYDVAFAIAGSALLVAALLAITLLPGQPKAATAGAATNAGSAPTEAPLLVAEV
jgi:EmrB/QacA subfamily drug resistance transporter